MTNQNKSIPFYIATICSSKGGVGKTTLTANLSALLSDIGQRVLIIDADKQPSLSSYYPIDYRSPDGFTSLIKEHNTETSISKTSVGVDIVINDDSEDLLSDWIIHTPDGRVRLKHVLKLLKDRYDIILIDTQGAIGPLQDIGVLAADFLISPIIPETISAKEFARGTMAMFNRLRPMANLGAPLGNLCGIIYKKDRTLISDLISKELKSLEHNQSLDGIRIIETAVPALSAYTKASLQQVPVHQFEKTRSGPTDSAWNTMLEITSELFPHLSGIITEVLAVKAGGISNG
ncbi:MAG: ParA family protein [Gammaproteobacteria bacterium]|jgi:chromosome partitioning related protein ParA|nr:ParA family protein [Gammaproteobacteria bacterium]